LALLGLKTFLYEVSERSQPLSQRLNPLGLGVDGANERITIIYFQQSL